jgi:hypothetical protein
MRLACGVVGWSVRNVLLGYQRVLFIQKVQMMPRGIWILALSKVVNPRVEKSRVGCAGAGQDVRCSDVQHGCSGFELAWVQSVALLLVQGM